MPTKLGAAEASTIMTRPCIAGSPYGPSDCAGSRRRDGRGTELMNGLETLGKDRAPVRHPAYRLIRGRSASFEIQGNGRNSHMARRKAPHIADELLDQLLSGTDAAAALQQGGLLDELKKALAERALNAEMDHH